MKAQKILQWILNIGLSIVLFILPFPRGLFFEKEILPVQIMIFSLFIIWAYLKKLKKEKLKIDTFLIISVILLPIAYILPLLFGVAASYYGALTYVFRYLSYMAIFLIISDITKSKKEVFLWLNVLGVSGTFAAILGIDAGLGKFINDFFGFYGGIDEFGRIRGVLQYSNSFAAYMGMVFFLLIALSILANKKYIKVIYSSLEVFPLIVLLMTVSRGAIIFVPFIYILLIILMPGKEKRLEIILSTIPSIIIALISGRMISEMVQPIMNNEGYGLIQKGWIITLVSFILSLILTFILLNAFSILSKVSSKIYIILIAVFGILGIVGGTILFTTGLYIKLLPQFLVQRFSQISSLTDITSGRNNFYRDGLRMLKDHWLLGGGGNAWAAMYRKYQSYFYGSSEAHSLPLQMWLETGILGILIFIFFIAAIFILYFKNRKKQTGVEITVLLIPFLMLLSHSIIDFDFSYFSLPVIGFALIGGMNGLKQKEEVDFSITPWIPLILGIIFIAFPISWQIGRNYAVKATDVMRKDDLVPNDLLEAINYLEKAVDFNGWNVNYMVRERDPQDSDLVYDLNILYEELYDLVKENDPENIDIVIKKQGALYEKAYKLEPYNPYVSMQWAKYLMESGKIEEGLEIVEKTVKLNPMFEGRYEELAQAYFVVGEFYLEQEGIETAKPYFKRVIQIEKDLEEINKVAIEKVVISDKTKEYIQKAKEYIN
ncbi:O-antigen ligase family protein [Defluviitalea phaphyphila]|uniref:O-antigen ligase family protein n=1 Tax=Defluviitalea phaphyphila TaxID=1473580 RepID=UPI00073086A2|nr:O-antigen ligase family protein [Defluviitalea phaphyphila]